MTTVFLIIAIAAVCVALLMLGLSITLIRKGHHIQGEVGENDEMKKRGLKCATTEILEEERALGLLPDDDEARCTPACANDCAVCTEHKEKR